MVAFWAFRGTSHDKPTISYLFSAYIQPRTFREVSEQPGEISRKILSFLITPMAAADIFFKNSKCALKKLANL